MATTNADVRDATVRVSQADSITVDEIARELCALEDGQLDRPAFLAWARHLWDELPVAIRHAVREFRRDPGPHGMLLLQGLPVDEGSLPDTPTVRGSVQRKANTPAAILLTIAHGLGDPAAFRNEKSGALVQDVVPVPGDEEVQGNQGSVRLTFHNENAFHIHRPDYVMLLCLRSDHESVAGLRTACIRTAIRALSEPGRKALFREEFRTEPPPSFGNSDGLAPVHAILSGAPEDPDIRVDLAATSALTNEAATALSELADALEQSSQTLRLRPGEMAIVDNRVTVHGRTAFQPRYDGKDRWVQRTFVLCDLRLSRDHRPRDGHVLTS